MIIAFAGCNTKETGYTKDDPVFIYDSLSMELIRNVPSDIELDLYGHVTKLIPLYDTAIVWCEFHDSPPDTTIGIFKVDKLLKNPVDSIKTLIPIFNGIMFFDYRTKKEIPLYLIKKTRVIQR